MLCEQYRRQQERLDRRAALAPWILANIHRDDTARREPFDLEEVVAWLGHGFQRVQDEEPARPVPASELAAKLDILAQYYNRNGAG